MAAGLWVAVLNVKILLMKRVQALLRRIKAVLVPAIFSLFLKLSVDNFYTGSLIEIHSSAAGWIF